MIHTRVCACVHLRLATRDICNNEDSQNQDYGMKIKSRGILSSLFYVILFSTLQPFLVYV